MIIRTIRKETFTSICNDLLNDTTITFRAKGLLCYLISRPPNWNANVNHLAKTFKEGRDALYSIMTELIEAGYMVRIQVKNGKGQIEGMEYHVYESKRPQEEIPNMEIPSGEKPANNKDGSLVNTESNKAGEPASPPKDEKKELRDRKISFMKLLIDWGIEHPDKYPKLMYREFVKYWIEESLGKKKVKLRFEEQRFFDVGRRLQTWFSKSNDQDISKQWEQEKKLPTINEIFKEILGINATKKD